MDRRANTRCVVAIVETSEQAVTMESTDEFLTHYAYSGLPRHMWVTSHVLLPFTFNITFAYENYQSLVA
jgi:hypothetical protein